MLRASVELDRNCDSFARRHGCAEICAFGGKSNDMSDLLRLIFDDYKPSLKSLNKLQVSLACLVGENRNCQSS